MHQYLSFFFKVNKVCTKNKIKFLKITYWWLGKKYSSFFVSLLCLTLKEGLGRTLARILFSFPSGMFLAGTQATCVNSSGVWEAALLFPPITNNGSPLRTVQASVDIPMSPDMQD